MLAPMIRTALTAACLGLVLAAAPALAATTITGHGSVAKPASLKLAKAGKKKKADKAADKGKPEEKALERPDEAPRDPRAAEPAAAPAAGGGGDAGMTNEVRQANAIYLFECRESALRSLLRKRTHFHEEIDETLE